MDLGSTSDSGYHLEVTKSLLSTSQLLRKLLERTDEQRPAKPGWFTGASQLRQSPQRCCLVVELKLEQLQIDVVYHRGHPVNTRGKKCFFPSMMDVAGCQAPSATESCLLT